MPNLEIPNFISLWTKAFIKKYAKDKYLIAVNLRLNPFFDADRNASLSVWRKLFVYCLEKHPEVMFVVLGRKNEIAEELRLPNVIFAQDHDINIQHTLSFIKHSLFYMAISSGPATFALLSEDIPYTIVSFRAPDISYNYNWFKPGSILPWQNKEVQKLVWERESPELLIREFNDLMYKTDKKKWIKKLDLENVDESILEWPYLIKAAEKL